VRRRLGAADDAVHPDVRRQVAVGLFEQLEGQIQLGLGDLLAEVVVETVCHRVPSEMGLQRGKALEGPDGDMPADSTNAAANG